MGTRSALQAAGSPQKDVQEESFNRTPAQDNLHQDSAEPAEASESRERHPPIYQWSVSKRSSPEWTSDRDTSMEGAVDCPKCAGLEKKVDEMQRVINRGAMNSADGMDLMREMQRGHNEAVQVLHKRIHFLEAEVADWEHDSAQLPEIKEVACCSAASCLLNFIHVACLLHGQPISFICSLLTCTFTFLFAIIDRETRTRHECVGRQGGVGHC